ncbi:hypothetical protein [Legionella bononiensis]|uniref:Coiled-coil-containing protein n=1 Tax=Legionella bononiensis TaxID=2793102 RepID=A0ABS1WBY5_9GAMM|nr:hypothetical protein [Legionella bononiensis]MBL7481161.1 hypothetical protein [Legionella bononiensis]MBL7526870.1 hypothetical protein [Legionella bononiensis]MBL7564277.1 hypothetical protein [Legionella bononiensis]
MSKNALYNLINARKRLAQFELPKDVNLLARTHRLGTDYYLFELPLEDELVIGEYRLIGHHLSVYAEPIGKLDYKSQYHYTAYFEKEGIQYRLHVFFDSRDYYFNQPYFAEIIAENEFKTINCQEHDAAFLMLAVNATRELVANLRESQALVLKSLEAEYDELEARILVLSENIQLNKAAYLSTLQQQIELLKQIVLYSNHPSSIEGKINWLRITETNIGSMDAEATSSEKDEKTEKIERKSTAEKNGTGYQVTHFKSHASKKSLPAEVERKESFSTVIQQLSSRAVVCQTMRDELLVNNVEKLYLDALGLEWVLESKHHYEVTLKDLNDLRALQNSIKQLGIGLLLRVLIRENYEQAAKLSTFYQMLPEKIVILALQNYKDKLLDFLLKNKIFPIHLKNITIADVVYPSIVDYCFRNAIKDPRALTCLDTLVKNGVSLMDIEASSGLPFAAILLLNPNHALREVLEQNASLTINNHLFYKQLNQVLRLIAAKSTCSSDLKTEITMLISSNQRRIDMLKHHIHLNEPERAPQYLEETLGEQMIQQLQDDPKIRYYKNAIEQRVAQLIPRLPRNQRRAIVDLTKVNFELIGNSLNRIQNFSEVRSFDEIRNDVVEQQRLILEFIELRDELIDNEKVIENMINAQRKPTKDQRKVVKRVKEIGDRLVEIQELIVKTESNSTQAMQDKGLTVLLEMKKVIEGVEGLRSDAAKESSESSSEPPRVDSLQAFGVFLSILENAQAQQSSSSSNDGNDMLNVCKIS